MLRDNVYCKYAGCSSLLNVTFSFSTFDDRVNVKILPGYEANV